VTNIRTRSVAAPLVTPQQRRHAAVALIGRGLDLDPGNPWDMAHGIAGALGLLGDRPPARPSRGWLDAHDPQLTGKPIPTTTETQ
jgi:hypothetical protein